MPIEVFAPAKVNLALHVTGQRADGYHLLDTLVSFADVGDWLRLSQGPVALRVTGPESAGVPEDGRNLVAKAVYHHAEKTGGDGRVVMALEKHLPPASGIGGGSSDAAAAIRGMMALSDTEEMWFRAGVLAVEASWDALTQLAKLDLLGLGADVPMCYRPEPMRVRGIGEEIAVIALPDLPCVLINPRVEVATPSVFKALHMKDNPAIAEAVPAFADAQACMDWLAGLRNDLQAPAVALQPVIGSVLDALSQSAGCGLARMSGSGATCFGLYPSVAAAQAAAGEIADAHPEWWVRAGVLGDQTGLAAPKVF